MLINLEKIVMNIFNNYHNTILELDCLKKRLNLILIYQKQYKEEEKQLREVITFQEKILLQIEHNVNELKGIQNKLFREIVINGTKVSSAIEKIASEENKDVSTLWKNYYPEVKQKIDKLMSDCECSENISN